MQRDLGERARRPDHRVRLVAREPQRLVQRAARCVVLAAREEQRAVRAQHARAQRRTGGARTELREQRGFVVAFAERVRQRDAAEIDLVLQLAVDRKRARRVEVGALARTVAGAAARLFANEQRGEPRGVGARERERARRVRFTFGVRKRRERGSRGAHVLARGALVVAAALPVEREVGRVLVAAFRIAQREDAGDAAMPAARRIGRRTVVTDRVHEVMREGVVETALRRLADEGAVEQLVERL